MSEDMAFEAAAAAALDGEALVLDLDGYEGPLHVLLMLARRQKVDLLAISIAELADQYLAFVQAARQRNFALAADYLVMAAYLAYLKSRLLLPKAPRVQEEEPAPEAQAAELAFRLAKLDAMRQASEALKIRPKLGQEVFMRGDPDAVRIIPSTRIEGDLYGLMSAYINQRKRDADRTYRPAPPKAYPLEMARDHVRGMMGEMKAWTSITRVAPLDHAASDSDGPSRASYLASTLSASLELVKEGTLEARQTSAFADLFLRARAA